LASAGDVAAHAVEIVKISDICRALLDLIAAADERS
jgi:hypothetical protein